MAVTYADVVDVEVRWRPLTERESIQADVLIGQASRMVRRLYPTTDARIAAGTLELEEVTDVVAGMVKRAMIGGDVEGVTQQNQTAGPFVRQVSFANPMGNLYFSAVDRQVLGETSRRAFTVDLTPTPYGWPG